MADEVYEGSVDLDIKKFLNGLELMEAAAILSATRVSAIFQALDQNIQSSLGGFTAGFSGIAQQVTALGAMMSGANSNAAQQVAATKQQLQQQKEEAAKAMQQQKDDAAAARQAQAAADKAAQQADKENRRDAREAKRADERADAEARRNARRDADQARREAATAQKQADADANKAAQDAARQKQTVIKEVLDALRAGFQVELAERKQFNNTLERETREASYRSLNELKSANAEQAREIERSYAEIRAKIEKQIKEQQQTQLQGLRAAEDAQKSKVSLLANKGDSKSVAAAENAYQRAVDEAKKAQQEEASLQRQLTNVIEVERKAQSTATARAAEEAKSEAIESARAFKGTWKEAISQAVADAQEKITKVEDKWNSIYRAGTQLSATGNGLLGFTKDINSLGQSLTESAGDFDFWNRRAVAAAQSANANLTSVFGGQKQTIDAFANSILDLGENLSMLKPAEVAESWFTYQAALGTTIKSQQDFAASRQAMEVILKAAIITDTDYTTTIKGVAQVLGEFQLGQEKAAEVTEILTSVTQRSQAEFADVLEGFKMVGPLMGEMGGSVQQTATMFTVLAEAGLKGSQAGRGMQMMLTRLLQPTGPAAEALEKVFNASGKLKNGWHDAVFEGGKFVGFLDTLNAKGETVSKGFLTRFAEATKGLTKEQRTQRLAEIFPENAFRNLIPLIRQYVDEVLEGGKALDGNTSKIRQLQTEFNNAALQATLFNDQWQIVSESIKVRLAGATNGIQTSLTRLGFVVAETFIPILEWVNKIIARFIKWGEEHPKLIRAIVGLTAAVGVLAGGAGAFLVTLGAVLQGVAALNIILTTTKVTGGVAVTTLRALPAALVGMLGPIGILLGALALLYIAWKTNFAGMGESLGEFFGTMSTEFSALGDLFGNVMDLVEAVIQGDGDKIKATFNEVITSIIEAFIILPTQMADALNGATKTLQTALSDLTRGMFIWGVNLMISLANGIAEGTNAVGRAVWGVAESIAAFFRSYSPPKYGPLKGIWVWGKNLIGTFIEGMNAADIDALDNVTGRIADALKLNIQYGGGDVGLYAETMTEANELTAQMIGLVQQGQKVTEEFFAPLKEGLGEWYEDVMQITLAYQEVYGLEHQIKLEQDRLDVIKEQRKEIEAQQKLREQAFDYELGKDDPNNSSSQFAKEEMVDPTSAAGKAKIASMRGSLSNEDFQNWINWQRKLWEQKNAAENAALQTQEDAQQLIIDAQSKQLEIVKAQYDYFVKMYEYAQKLLKLEEDEKALRKSGGGGGGSAANSLLGTPEDLEAAKKAIAGIVGEDKTIEDEDTLSNNRGGDDIGGYGDATRQREREEQRLSDLEKENRKRRADYEQQLINAKSDAERDEIKRQKDAWDAAYKDEKQRLQERVANSKEVQDASEKKADESMAGRVAGVEAEYQKEISAILGDQTNQIADANALKEQGGSLDEAQIKARDQLRTEERKLQDLRQTGDQKRIDFERRIREAGKDPEKVRRIKEEQEAWEAAYKAAIEAQEARTNAARRAEQDLGDQARAEQMREEETAKGKKEGAGGGSIPGYSGGIAAPDFGDFNPEDKPTSAKDETSDAHDRRQKDRDSLSKAREYLENIKKDIELFGSESVDVKTKLERASTIIKDSLNWDDDWDWLADDATREYWQGLREKINNYVNSGQGIVDSATIAVQIGGWVLKILGAIWDRFVDVFTNGWTLDEEKTSDNLTIIKGALKWFKDKLVGIWSGLVNSFVTDATAKNEPEGKSLGEKINSWLINKLVAAWLWATGDLGKSDGGPVMATATISPSFTAKIIGWIVKQINSLWKTVEDAWDKAWGGGDEGGAGAAGKASKKVSFQSLADQLASTWKSIKEAATGAWKDIKDGWDNFWKNTKQGATEAWQNFKQGWDAFWKDKKDTAAAAWKNLKDGWDNLWANAKEKWEGFKSSFSEQWNTAWDNAKTKYDEWKGWFSEQFNAVWDNAKTKYDEWKGLFSEAWNSLWDTAKAKYDEVKEQIVLAIDTVKSKWDDVKRALDDVVGPLNSVFKAISALANLRMPSWMGGGSDGAGGGSGGSYGNGNSGGGAGRRGGAQAEGSFAVGLDYVPRDGFLAELHKGERVLTSAESAAYRSIEKAGLLNVLNALANGATQRLAQTLGGASNVTIQQTVRQGDQKTVNFGDFYVDATNPDEGRALMNRLSFLT